MNDLESGTMDCSAFSTMVRRVSNIIKQFKLENAQTERVFLHFLLDQQRRALIKNGVSRGELENFDVEIRKTIDENLDNDKPYVIPFPKWEPKK